MWLPLAIVALAALALLGTFAACALGVPGFGGNGDYTRRSTSTSTRPAPDSTSTQVIAVFLDREEAA